MADDASLGDVRRAADALRPLLNALELAGKVLQAAQNAKAEVATREDQIASLQARADELVTAIAARDDQLRRLDGDIAAERAVIQAAVNDARRDANMKIGELKAEVSEAIAKAGAAKEQAARATATAREQADKAIAAMEAEVSARRLELQADIKVAEDRLLSLTAAIEDLKRKF